ncbi:hypothetical protein BT96DRAFT_947624 [Gymnopus androsaceus JB14]|uniref:Uncharacterized protein n=1 Tax=Gymnopus androsaceus JB14 TaxID=1447944 RepID=A0A6A4GTH5_9AGAR|nr:hypothetical protein BT96DRAFT_947624 [Gymnopus androsaceus JB14]
MAGVLGNGKRARGVMATSLQGELMSALPFLVWSFDGSTKSILLSQYEFSTLHVCLLAHKSKYRDSSAKTPLIHSLPTSSWLGNSRFLNPMNHPLLEPANGPALQLKKKISRLENHLWTFNSVRGSKNWQFARLALDTWQQKDCKLGLFKQEYENKTSLINYTSLYWRLPATHCCFSLASNHRAGYYDYSEAVHSAQILSFSSSIGYDVDGTSKLRLLSCPACNNINCYSCSGAIVVLLACSLVLVFCLWVSISAVMHELPSKTLLKLFHTLLSLKIDGSLFFQIFVFLYCKLVERWRYFKYNSSQVPQLPKSLPNWTLLEVEDIVLLRDNEQAPVNVVVLELWIWTSYFSTHTDKPEPDRDPHHLEYKAESSNEDWAASKGVDMFQFVLMDS